MSIVDDGKVEGRGKEKKTRGVSGHQRNQRLITKEKEKRSLKLNVKHLLVVHATLIAGLLLIYLIVVIDMLWLFH